MLELTVEITKIAGFEPVTVADAGDTDAPLGSPEAVIVTCPLKLCEPVTNTFMLATPFGVTVTAEGLAEIVKSAAPRIVSEAPLVLVFVPLVPVMATT